MPEYFDISPLIAENLAVFPDDRAYARKINCDYADHHYQTSEMTTTVHIGAHADAPRHFHADGAGIDQCDLNHYFGLCQVIHVYARNEDFRVKVADIKNYKITAPRVLIATNSFTEPTHWHHNFMAFSPEVIEYLAEQDVRLVGIDTPSIDPARDPYLYSHQACLKYELAILEGLVLQGIPEGNYFLIALPLKLKDADASPVRAILVKDLKSMLLHDAD